MLGEKEVDSAYVANFCPKSCEICDIHLDSRDLDLGIGLPQTAPDIDDKSVRNKVRAHESGRVLFRLLRQRYQ